MQKLELASSAAELQTLLEKQGLAEDLLACFQDAVLVNLLNKGFSTPDMLATADEDMLEEPPQLSPALRRTLLEQFNPGGSCSTCCI